MNRPILIIGASGLLGSRIKNYFDSKSIYCIGTSCYKDAKNTIKLNIQNTNEVNSLIKDINPYKIFICSALTNVDLCEKDPALSYDINTIGVKRIIDASNNLNKKPIITYFSSEYIFHKDKKSQSSIYDIPNPSNVYGMHKLLSEHYLMSKVDNWNIIRTCNIFGYANNSKNFALSVINNYKDKKDIIIRKDQVDTPTFADHLALFSINLAPINKISHFVSTKKPISRYNFAKLLIDKIGKELYGDIPYNIISREFGDADRPNYGLLSSCKLFNSETNFKVALKDFTKQIKGSK